MTTIVKRDEISRTWRVVCPEHGQLAEYRGKAFHAAARDARQHDAAWHDTGKREPARGACAPRTGPAITGGTNNA